MTTTFLETANIIKQLRGDGGISLLQSIYAIACRVLPEQLRPSMLIPDGGPNETHSS